MSGRAPFVDESRNLAIAQHSAFAVVGGLLDRDRPQCMGHEVPPAILMLASALRPAYDEPVDGARHRDVEQPPMLVLGLAPRPLARGSDHRDVRRLGARPDKAIGTARRRAL